MKRLSNVGKKINGQIGKALATYQLIEEGDKILVAVSGGKDSLTLLHFLKMIQSWTPVKFGLFATHIKTDFHCASCVHTQELTKLFESMGLEYCFDKVSVLDENKQTNCFWCSWNKRKALFQVADKLDCNKIAFGHHKDDIIETVVMGLFYNGEISAMNPKQKLFDGRITIIRPLCYVEEAWIRTFAREQGFGDKMCKCPFGSESKRKYVKDLIEQVQLNTPEMNVRTNIFKSISRVRQDYIDLRGHSL